MYWYEYNPNGEIVAFGCCAEGTLQEAFGNREILLRSEEILAVPLAVIVDGEVCPRKSKPTYPATWDGVTHTWIPDLIRAREEARNRITVARNAAELAGFNAYGKPFDSDPVAVQRISVAVQAAQAMGEAFSIEWTCADDSTILLDYPQMMALPTYMAVAANVLHVKARTLKGVIDTADTIEEIEAVQWS